MRTYSFYLLFAYDQLLEYAPPRSISIPREKASRVSGLPADSVDSAYPATGACFKLQVSCENWRMNPELSLLGRVAPGILSGTDTVLTGIKCPSYRNIRLIENTKKATV